MLYKATQTATIVLLLAIVATLFVPRDYRLYTLGIAGVSLLILVVFTAIVFVAPKRWREERKR